MSGKARHAEAEAWLQRLTLRQKIGQMTMAERQHVTPEEVRRYGLGALLSGGGSCPGENRPADWVKMNDDFWQAAMEGEGSVGIPILYGVDAVHGHNNVSGATLFPHNIGLGAAGDPELIGRIARITAKEVLATGLEWNFAPTVAVVQNCQWGRTFESFGSCPQAVAAAGEACIRGLQQEGVIGCVKHWLGDGGTSHGMDQGETTLDWESLQATHMAAYLPALKAGAMSLMVSFNSWNGEKCHGHRFLLTETLKERLGFAGIVVTDWNGIDYLDKNFAVAVRLGINAGIDMVMVPEKWREFIDILEKEVLEGRVDEARIDDAVRRILLTKLHYGLFEKGRPAARKTTGEKDFGSAKHRQVAREAVRKSLVLLKNEAGLLPLAPETRLLVAGKSADNLGNQCGGWTLSWEGERNGERLVGGTSIWEGVRTLAPSAMLSRDLSGADADPSRHDAALVVIGETAYVEGFGDIRPSDELLEEVGARVKGLMNPLKPYARSLKLAQIHPEDLACIRRIKAKGIPVVTLLVSGRPLVVNEELDASDAFVAAWLPGSEGLGVAEVLFGRHEFVGRLPLPWPASDTPAGATGKDALWERGYGLGAGES